MRVIIMVSSLPLSLSCRQYASTLMFSHRGAQAPFLSRTTHTRYQYRLASWGRTLTTAVGKQANHYVAYIMIHIRGPKLTLAIKKSRYMLENAVQRHIFVVYDQPQAASDTKRLPTRRLTAGRPPPQAAEMHSGTETRAARACTRAGTAPRAAKSASVFWGATRTTAPRWGGSRAACCTTTMRASTPPSLSLGGGGGGRTGRGSRNRRSARSRPREAGRRCAGSVLGPWKGEECERGRER